MSNSNETGAKMSNYRWEFCSMLFLATAATYMDRQVLSRTYKHFIAPELKRSTAH